MYIHKVMKKKIDIARSSAERDLTISTTKQIEALWNGQEWEDLRCQSAQTFSMVVLPPIFTQARIAVTICASR